MIEPVAIGLGLAGFILLALMGVGVIWDRSLMVMVCGTGGLISFSLCCVLAVINVVING